MDTVTNDLGSLDSEFKDLLDKLRKFEDALELRFENAEAELVAQDAEFRKFIAELVKFESEVRLFMATPPSGAIVTSASNSTNAFGQCWGLRTAIGDSGQTYHIQWSVLGELKGLCYIPNSLCVREVRIGLPLPRSCGG